jgi:hypothetical protein
VVGGRRSVGILRHECGGRKNERWEWDVEMARCLVLPVPQTQRRHAAISIRGSKSFLGKPMPRIACGMSEARAMEVGRQLA